MKKSEYPNFCRILRAARKSKKLSTADMALKIGVDVATYRKWEFGEEFPDDDSLVKINRALFGSD